MTVEEEFDALAEELADAASERAAAVTCSASQYREGLRTILSTLRMRLETDIHASKETDD